MIQKPKINIRTISEMTGFSPATVSNALNHKPGVKRQTSDEIFRVAKELGYINSAALNKLRVVVYRKPESVIIDNPFFSKLLTGAEQTCRENGFEVLVTYLDPRLSTYEHELAAVLEDHSCGIVMLGSELDEKELPRFKASGLPLVFIDYWDEDMETECILNNSRESVRRLTEYLLQKGHRQIGHIRSKMSAYPFHQREAALVKTLAAHGAPLDPRFIFDVQSSMDGAYLDMARLLAQKPTLPTAFFADNDVIALGAMRAMREAGLCLPEDVSIVGFDDVPMGEISAPRLTTVHVQQAYLGRLAAMKIIESSQDPMRSKSSILVATSFVERDSVRDLNQA